MTRATVVIGANFGDEGKGLMTDYFCVAPGNRATVVRFNGGAQAGHTVDHGVWRRHVFHHVGAGALRGAETFLSRFFIANPILFNAELAELQARFGLKPVVAVDREALLTTPYDMLINQAVEIARGDNRHGSCGVGINETVHRSIHGVPTYVSDLESPSRLRNKLEAIREFYLERRLLELGLNDAFLDTTLGAALRAPDLNARFLGECAAFSGSVEIVDRSHLDPRGPVIFEGAQGLLLDQDHRFFPHVTRSSTGLKNVVTLADEAGIDDLEVVYTTRAYMTRHGAGPFPTEDAGLVLPDKTNVPHPFQKTLRFGWLDIDLLHDSIRLDLAHAARRGNVRPRLAITCVDQLAGEIGDFPFYRHGRGERAATSEEFIETVMGELSMAQGFASFGPQSIDVVKVRSLPALRQYA